MDQQKVLRLGAAAVILAIGIRLLSAGFFYPLKAVFQNRMVLSLLMYLETGRVIRFPEAQPESVPPTEPEQETEIPTEPSLTEPEATSPPAGVVFGAEDLDLVDVQYHCAYRPDLPELLTQPLDWCLTGEAPAVLILHTHGSETYSDGDYAPSGDYRTLDTDYNMVSIGAELARILEAGGISIIHDTTLYDYPDYNNAYSDARKAIKRHLEQHPGIQLVLDLHRDASDGTEGQLVTSATAGGQRCAQIMVVAGTDAGGNRHPDWQENLSLGLKLSALLEQTNPGITRPISLRAQRFNMDLTPGSLLIEVGAAGNTHGEAILAVNALAQGILELAHGANRSD